MNIKDLILGKIDERRVHNMNQKNKVSSGSTRSKYSGIIYELDFLADYVGSLL